MIWVLHMSNPLLSIAVSWIACQCILKPLIASFKAGHFVPEAVWWQGGMPSGHAALVGALCSAIAKSEGFGTIAFSTATVFSLIVLYEALVTRNMLMRQTEALQSLTKHKLQPVVGHQPLEVAAGLAVGILVARYVM